jgi:hypothetical protein
LLLEVAAAGSLAEVEEGKVSHGLVEFPFALVLDIH